MNRDNALGTDQPRRSASVLIFGFGIAALVLYLVTFAIDVHKLNDFYREAWPPYQLLTAGHLTGFLRAGPAYVGSLILRAPFALVASAFAAGRRGTYIATALPCLLAPALLTAWLASGGAETGQRASVRRGRAGVRPLDLFMITPPAVVCAAGGHPEEVLGATLCVLTVLLAQRGSGTAAGFMLGLAFINKTWAVAVVPLVFAVMPPDQRLRGAITAVATAGIVMIPVTAVRATSPGSAGGSLGGTTVGIFLPPQLLWWFGRNSWVAREAHFLLVAIDWIVTAVWWWLRTRRRSGPPRAERALMTLALLLFLRCALDPWDNLYYFTPFMLAVMTLENARGFPKLTWIYAILLVIVVPISGVLHGLGHGGEAVAFAIFALPTIAWFGWRAFSEPELESDPQTEPRQPTSGTYTATTESDSAA